MAVRTSYVKTTRSDKTSTFAGNISVSGNISTSGNLTVNGTMTFGDAATDNLTINGAATFNADSTFSTNKKLQFRDTGIYINSGADGKLVISADGTGNDDITLSGTVVLGGISLPYASKNAAYTTTADDSIVGVDTTSAAVTITLGSASVSAGKIIIIKDTGGNAGTNNITIDTEGTETIDGAASTSIATNYGVVRLFSDGTNWFTF